MEADLLDAVDEVGRLGRSEQAVALCDQSRSDPLFMGAFMKRSRSGRTWLNRTRPMVVRTVCSVTP